MHFRLQLANAAVAETVAEIVAATFQSVRFQLLFHVKSLRRRILHVQTALQAVCTCSAASDMV